jgi:hypothetical protein
MNREIRRQGGKEARRQGGKEARRQGGKEARRQGERRNHHVPSISIDRQTTLLLD